MPQLQLQLQPDRQTDKWTDGFAIANIVLHTMQHDKKDNQCNDRRSITFRKYRVIRRGSASHPAGGAYPEPLVGSEGGHPSLYTTHSTPSAPRALAPTSAAEIRQIDPCTRRIERKRCAGQHEFVVKPTSGRSSGALSIRCLEPVTRTDCRKCGRLQL